MGNNEQGTKEKIIEVAGRLFAAHGFDSASIRDISKEADVNVASINYHFKNKQLLYKEVMNSNILKIEESIRIISESSEDIKDFNWKIFCSFTENSNMFINSFKLFINNTLPEDEDLIPEACNASCFAPPGFKYMLELVNKELGDKVSQDNKEWAIRTMFAYITHISLISCSTFGKMMSKRVDFLKVEMKKESIYKMTDAILNYLK